ncbi:SecE/sec61-gamma family protein translocase subunit [Desulfurococcus mucosus]|uniref:Protein translocase subunit secE/sec61 gamma n=1 Tax=Desulfurococcus mucosus (strain ATCC 35584 / DSM 2162 / JCM 9187 / O7/1) TaxID=765177 RepID=E8RAA8_DESM0|nr:preprotein translocase subunit SecE [Desulfurococcus mucosus]ADV65414.1 protein translocase subunit secE/sec61 gamma [Desulfurococcus mucosus DSM 2162]
MDLRELVDSWRRILLIASRPGLDEYLTVLKISLLGLALVGGISFAIRMVFYTFLYPYTG